MNRTQASAAARAASSARSAARREEYRAHRDQGLTEAQAAAALGVAVRQGQRYEQHLRMNGWCPPEPKRAKRSAELRRCVLSHLAKFPNSALSYYELVRVADPLRKRSSVENLMMRLAEEGVVEVVVGEHDPGVDRRPARRYRLAPSVCEEAA